MTDSKPASRLSEQLKSEHHSLRSQARHLRSCFDPDRVSSDSIQEQVAETRKAIVALTEQLISHFRLEEKEGLVDSIVEARPELARPARQLLDDHREIEARFLAIQSRLEESTIESVEGLKNQWREVILALTALLAHEERETGLIMDCFYDETGGRG